MKKEEEEKHYIAMEDVCELLNRDPQHVREFLDASSIAFEMVDDRLCVDVQELTDCITDMIWDYAD